MPRRKKKNKNKKVLLVLLVVIFILLLAGFVTYNVSPPFSKYVDGIIEKYFNTNKEDNKGNVEGNLSIHFLELGNKYTGDCIYIKAGDTDILVDAGSRTSSSTTIKNYLSSYVTDNKLEYVIVTHADQDHISGFVGSNAAPGIFATYECENIIDFNLTNKDTTKTTSLIGKYITKRNEEVSAGANHYTALDCYSNTNGGKRKYTLSDGIELEILYNYFYDHKSADENNYSVCFMINQGDSHFLFTGDLEKEGEEHLVEYNTLPEVELFKAGHHGSKTSSNDVLLEVIKPKIVCVCCCAGSDEYTKVNDNMFPTQAFVSRISKYTDKVYVTSLATDNELGYTSMNGNIIVTSTKEGINVNCSNNNTILKDTVWFKENRKWE